ncbi:hypothetical protein Tco_1456932 [Tanacetum coccineum]
MAPKRATRSTRAPPTPNETTTTVTEAQLQALIDQGVAAAMAEAEASPGGEIKKIETEMWNLKVKGTDVVAYSRRFQQLALMCSRMFPEEIDKVEKYIGGLPDMITCKRKRKNDDFSRNNQNQQVKRQNTGPRPTLQAIVAGNHTPGLNLCVPSVTTIMKVLVHLVWAKAILKVTAKTRNNGPWGISSWEMTGLNAKVYVVGNAGANPDKCRCGSQIDITPSTLDHYYDVELADGRIIGLNTILKGCTLNFLNHQFNINLMPVELGSFDVIIGMDWLAKAKSGSYVVPRRLSAFPGRIKP